LYALASRQFYRDCRIYGTVDFVFGNAIACFQNCELVCRRPLPGQQNTVTAQGRKTDVDISGYSFQNCNVVADGELTSAGFTVNSYLGRPWRAYSRTVFMSSFLDGVVNPAGWLSWNSTDPYLDTLYYAEYCNFGPGSATGGRVAWPGVHPALNYTDALSFSAENFILGSTWLPLHVTPYTSILDHCA
jgi:pectinesterase